MSDYFAEEFEEELNALKQKLKIAVEAEIKHREQYDKSTYTPNEVIDVVWEVIDETFWEEQNG
jgi:hypothetical protein